MLYMIIERFKNGDPVPVYRRFRDEGRLMPESLEYVGSWVTEDLGSCFQVIESPDRAALEEWIANWSDVTDFEVVPVKTSAEALAEVTPML